MTTSFNISVLHRFALNKAAGLDGRFPEQCPGRVSDPESANGKFYQLLDDIDLNEHMILRSCEGHFHVIDERYSLFTRIGSLV